MCVFVASCWWNTCLTATFKSLDVPIPISYQNVIIRPKILNLMSATMRVYALTCCNVFHHFLKTFFFFSLMPYKRFSKWEADILRGAPDNSIGGEWKWKNITLPSPLLMRRRPQSLNMCDLVRTVFLKLFMACSSSEAEKNSVPIPHSSFLFLFSSIINNVGASN